ncbi:Chitin synthesis regulation, Congo red resistance, RCR protein [Metarhizium album ARSEF 1941]|uniref:Chitin synthesis regulation, Congo red resistance, RCR protein n=1 Tax=Metarhizium album (strain ARSEF 1941) TaxID=1081103 RepID=A0A0B2WT61_METAS|nr:Chitin synthesis regulation, Congo red resistance, RCR protein [Metarhizium album ARSEF 1941]KHN96799.1 Chitin synthesis regulation, Congo red resistance, RCR protein [Metarhizium album ARSEF 1941]
MAVAARDVISENGDTFYVPWWHTKTGIIVRWVIFLVIFALILGYLIGGYYHARARIRKGLQPLAYHRCLVSRRSYQPTYPQQWPQYQFAYYPPQQTGHQNVYPMNDMPLPAYDPNRPPMYSGPPGGSKIDPLQNRTATHRVPESNPAPEYAPPPGPPLGR